MFSRSRALAFAALGSFVSASAMAADESGITTTDTLAVISDAKAKLIVVVLAAVGATIAIKWVKKLRSAA